MGKLLQLRNIKASLTIVTIRPMLPVL